MPMEFFSVGKKMKNVYSRRCHGICEKYEINQTCLDVLMFLSNHPKHNTARDLCQVRGIKTGIVSVAIETLMERGFIKSIEDSDDRRVKRLVTTEEAKPLIEDGKKVQCAFMKAVCDGVTKEELDECKRIFTKFIENIKEMDKGDN